MFRKMFRLFAHIVGVLLIASCGGGGSSSAQGDTGKEDANSDNIAEEIEIENSEAIAGTYDTSDFDSDIIDRVLVIDEFGDFYPYKESNELDCFIEAEEGDVNYDFVGKSLSYDEDWFQFTVEIGEAKFTWQIDEFNEIEKMILGTAGSSPTSGSEIYQGVSLGSLNGSGPILLVTEKLSAVSQDEIFDSICE